MGRRGEDVGSEGASDLEAFQRLQALLEAEAAELLKEKNTLTSLRLLRLLCAISSLQVSALFTDTHHDDERCDDDDDEF
eukprot:3937834-Rhodomonas_salina.2